MKLEITVIFLIGVLASCQGQLVPSCFGLPSGYVFNNPAAAPNYYICMNSVPIPMQCLSGYVFCQGGSVCVSSCSATATTAAPITTTTLSTTTLATIPTTFPTTAPTTIPTTAPTTIPTTAPTTILTTAPTTILTTQPTAPTVIPTTAPTTTPSTTPSTPPPTTTPTPTTAPPTTTPAASVNCANSPDGTLLANPSSCSSYFMCIGGVPQAGKCLGSYAFNASTGTCSSKKC